MFHCRPECGVNFNGIVSTKAHACQLIVGEMLDHFQQAGIGTEQVLTEVSSAFDEVFLILTVADFTQTRTSRPSRSL